MACSLGGTKSLSATMLGYNLLETQEQTSVKSYDKLIICIEENAFENDVWKMADIFKPNKEATENTTINAKTCSKNSPFRLHIFV